MTRVKEVDCLLADNEVCPRAEWTAFRDIEGFKGFDYAIAYDVVYVFIAYPGIIIRIVIFKCIRYSEDG